MGEVQDQEFRFRMIGNLELNTSTELQLLTMQRLMLKYMSPT